MANLNQRREINPNVRYIDETTGKQVACKNNWQATNVITDITYSAVFFSRLIEQVIDHIKHYANKCIVVGCVAWLTNPEIIDALRQYAESVLLLVNDENYASYIGGKCLHMYQSLPAITQAPARIFAHLPDTPMQVIQQREYFPVRCIRGASGALMHSKYIVFFQRDALGQQWPTAVWTGSMNYTKRAGRNLENALFVKSTSMARAYFDDFTMSFLQSGALRTQDLTPEEQRHLENPNADLVPYTAAQKRTYMIRKKSRERKKTPTRTPTSPLSPKTIKPARVLKKKIKNDIICIT